MKEIYILILLLFGLFGIWSIITILILIKTPVLKINALGQFFDSILKGISRIFKRKA